MVLWGLGLIVYRVHGFIGFRDTLGCWCVWGGGFGFGVLLLGV